MASDEPFVNSSITSIISFTPRSLRESVGELRHLRRLEDYSHFIGTGRCRVPDTSRLVAVVGSNAMLRSTSCHSESSSLPPGM